MKADILHISEELERLDSVSAQVIGGLNEGKRISEPYAVLGNQFVNQTVCDIGQDFFLFKSTFCDVLTVSTLYIVSSFFTLGMFSVPLVVLAFQGSMREESEYEEPSR
jgi:hypothetical protein